MLLKVSVCVHSQLWLCPSDSSKLCDVAHLYTHTHTHACIHGVCIYNAYTHSNIFLSYLCTGIAVAPIILISVREPKRTKNLKVESEKPVEQDTKPSFASRLVLLIKTFLYPGMFMLCIAGGIRNAGGYVWAYNTELFFQAQDLSNAQINHFMSWIPLVGGSLGAIFGGLISDLLVKNRSTYVRIWVLIVSQVR